MLVDRINLESGEEVLTMSRRHKFLIILECISLLLVAVLPLAIYVFVIANTTVMNFDLNIYFPLLTYLYCVWLLGVWVTLFTVWTDYYLDILVITNHRLIMTNQKGFWRRSISSFRLERLQEVNVEIDGLLSTLFDFGTLRVETAGHGSEDFHMNNLPDPKGLKALIMDALEKHGAVMPVS